MEYDKINNLLLSEDNESEQLSKFVTREYVRVNGLSNTYNENKSIRFKTPMLRSNLCDYSDAYILVKGTITVTGNHPRHRQNRPLIIKNNAPFISCITGINGELIEDADDLDIVMPMYNLLEYSKYYRKSIGSLCNYYRDELSDDNDNDNFGNIKVVNSEAFKYKNKITGNTYNVNSTILNPAGNARINNPNYVANNSGKKSIELAIPLKYLGNFCRALNIPLKSGFKREMIWNKYRSQMTTEAVNNNLNNLIDPTFTNVNRLFVLAYQNADDRQSFSQFYLPNVIVKDYNVIIDKLAFFDLPIKTEEEAYEKIIDISRNKKYTTGNLLDYDYFKKHYKLIAIDLNKQQVLPENEDLIQQINFIGKLEEAANVFIIIEKRENTIFHKILLM